MAYIKKIVIKNFKKFETFEATFNQDINIIVGDNEAGKSTIIQAIDFVLRGSRGKIESAGMESLFNKKVIKRYMQGDRRYEELPKLEVEVYLGDYNNEETSGMNNSKDEEHNGLKLICEPDIRFSKEISENIALRDMRFPFEFYTCTFTTFTDHHYNSYKKYLKHILIDNSSSNSDYAMKEYVENFYHGIVDNGLDRIKHQYNYGQNKTDYSKNNFKNINEKIQERKLSLGLKTHEVDDLYNQMSIFEEDIDIKFKGKGKLNLIKTELSLMKDTGRLDVVLIEEPENHLSHNSMSMMIDKMKTERSSQLFITTHNSLICSHLNLKKLFILTSSENNAEPMVMLNLETETENYFLKSANSSLLEFVLSKKVILVEGPTEHMLMDVFYHKINLNDLKKDQVHVISVGGKSFKRYLDLARSLKIQTVAILDNDANYKDNCLDNYKDYEEIPHVKIFYDKDDSRRTFEYCFYNDNKIEIDKLFSKEKKKVKDVLRHMLVNKTDCALFALNNLDSKKLIVPSYIAEAVKWIKK